MANSLHAEGGAILQMQFSNTITLLTPRISSQGSHIFSSIFYQEQFSTGSVNSLLLVGNKPLPNILQYYQCFVNWILYHPNPMGLVTNLHCVTLHGGTAGHLGWQQKFNSI